MIVLVLLFVLPCYATRIKQTNDMIGGFSGDGGNAQDDSVKASLDLLHSKVTGEGAGTGNSFYVDSGATGLGTGISLTDAMTTLDAAVALCSDNNGDVIYVAAGHNENWTGTDSADIDVIGVTIIGLGTGSNRPRFDYDDADAELVIGAANVKLYNLTFQPGYNQVVHAIEIEADADGSIIDNCEFMDGEAASTDEFLDAIQPDAAADDLIISNCIAISVSSTSDGANTWLDMTVGVIDNIRVVNNYVLGDYADAAIFSDDIDTHSYIAYNVITNIHTGIHAIEFSTTATGLLYSNYCASDTPGTIVDPGSMENAMNIEADYGAAEDAEAGPGWALKKATAATNNYPDNVEPDSLFAFIMVSGTTATASTFDNTTDSLQAIADAVATVPQSGGTTSWNATALAAIEGEATDAIEADSLDKLIAADDRSASLTYPDSVATESIMAFLMSKSASPIKTSYNNTTDSLEAISDRVVDVNLWTNNNLEDCNSYTRTYIGECNDYSVSLIVDSNLWSNNNLSDCNSYTKTYISECNDYAVSIAEDSNLWSNNNLEDCNSYTKTYIGECNDYAVSVVEDSNLWTNNHVDDCNGRITQMLGRFEGAALPAYDTSHYLAVTVDFDGTTGAGHWGLSGETDEVLTVTGAVRIRLLMECTDTCTGTDGGTIALWAGTSEDVILAATVINTEGADNTNLDSGEIWLDTSPTEHTAIGASGFFDFVVVGGLDVGLDCQVQDIADGTIVFHVWWTPLDATGNVVAGGGGTL